eukprot:SM000025S08479  [mRNA]  locus=s25:949777:954042:- [translate_table: standard]
MDNDHRPRKPQNNARGHSRYDRSHPAQCATKAGYAVACAARAKELKYADHPREDEFFPLAIDTHGALGARWLELLTQLARHTIARRFHGERVDFLAVGSLAQVYRMRLAVSLQRSMARALHRRAGRALAAASGSGQGTHFHEPSISDLWLLSRDVFVAEMGSPAAYLSLLRRRVSACLQRAQANALHQKAGRALVGGRRAPFLASSIHASISDLYVLTRLLVSCSLRHPALLTLSSALGSDHPAGDEFVPLAVDVHGAFGSKWLDLLHRLARRAAARRLGQRGEQPGFNVAGSLAQVFRMRLAVSMQRSLAFVVHLRAGRALAAAFGFHQGDVFPPASYSDLHLLTRVLRTPVSSDIVHSFGLAFPSHQSIWPRFLSAPANIFHSSSGRPFTAIALLLENALFAGFDMRT